MNFCSGDIEFIPIFGHMGTQWYGQLPLEVSDESRLNSNAHILLCITAAADKTFRDVKASVGVQKLIGDGGLSSWNSYNSIWYF